MSFWRRTLRRPRLFDEVSFALGGALVWAGAVMLAVATMQVVRAPEAGARVWFEASAQGFGLGWLGGLFWCALLALQARQHEPVPAVAALMRGTWLAALAGLAAAALVASSGVGVLWAVLAGVVVATAAGRVWLVVVAARSRR
jgi:hypothetical protein